MASRTEQLGGGKPQLLAGQAVRQILVERNKIFLPCWESRRRYVVMKGSAGSGKSMDTAIFYLVRLLSDVGRNLLCVRKIDVSNRNSTFALLVSTINRLALGSLFEITQAPMKIRCFNGNEVIFGGVNDDAQREKLKSITTMNGMLTDIWVEEATELTQADFEILDDRLRGILPPGLFYQIRLTFNPVSSGHWLKKVFFDRQDAQVLAHHSTYLDNKFCDEAYHQRMLRRQELDPEGYKIYGLGQWGESSGLILTNYQIQDRVWEDSYFDYLCYGQDFGYNHPNVLLKVGMKDGEVYVLKELVSREKATDEIIALAADWDKGLLMLCDSAEPDRIRMWRQAGFLARGVRKYPGSVKSSIDWLLMRKIYIHPACVRTIEEIQQWRWLKDKDGAYLDEPTPFVDDAMAALRYSCFQWIPRGFAPTDRVVPPPPAFHCLRQQSLAGLGKEKIQVR